MFEVEGVVRRSDGVGVVRTLFVTTRRDLALEMGAVRFSTGAFDSVRVVRALPKRKVTLAEHVRD